jgi:hypothetical protein
MLNISCYAEADLFDRVDVSDILYRWLIESGFFKLGNFEKKTILIEKEETEISAILLNFETRNRLSKFLRDKIVEEKVVELTDSLDSLLFSEKDAKALSEIKTLSDLRKLVEDERYHYLE